MKNIYIMWKYKIYIYINKTFPTYNLPTGVLPTLTSGSWAVPALWPLAKPSRSASHAGKCWVKWWDPQELVITCVHVCWCFLMLWNAIIWEHTYLSPKIVHHLWEMKTPENIEPDRRCARSFPRRSSCRCTKRPLPLLAETNRQLGPLGW